MTQRRRHLKVAATAAVVAAAALSLVGCSASSDSGSSESGEGSLTVAILDGPGFNDCIPAAAEKFTEETGVPVDVVPLPYASMLDKYQTAFSAGTSPYDLVNISFQWTGQLAAIGGLEKLDASAADELKGVSQTLQDQYTYEGEPYGVPYLSSVYGYFYRTDILNTLGLSSFPSTAQGVQDLITQIAADPSLGVTPISIMGDKTQGMANFNGLYRGFGGPAFEAEDGSVNPIDVEAAAEALDALRVQADNSPPGVLNATFSTTPTQFADGTVAILPVQNTTFGNLMESDASKVSGKYAFAAEPGGGDLGGWGMAVTAGSSKKANAQKFATYLAGPEADLMCASKFSKGPVQEENFTDPDLVKAIPFLPQVVTALDEGSKRYAGANAGAQNDVIDSVTSQFLAGQIASSRDAAQQISDQIEATVK